MAVLERITQMKGSGMPTAQIIQSLKEQGLSPKEINEALAQSEIKSELIRTNQTMQQETPQFEQPSDLQPSIESQMQMSPEQQEEQYPEYTPEQYQQQDQQAQQEQEQYQYQQPIAYPEYQSPQSIDYETISDIVSQIIDEKMKEIKKELSLATKFRKNAIEKIKELENNINKIEQTMNELQMAIIKKIGSYGEHIETIAKELKATQNSFSKMLNPVMDRRDNQQINKKNKSEKNDIDEQTDETNEETNKGKERDSFEDYLR